MIVTNTDVLVIGGGAVGASVARELSHYEIHVLIVEKEQDVAFGTSKANSGIVHSGIHEAPGSLKACLCVQGNALYPKLAEELNVLYKRNGQIIVARCPEELHILDELVNRGQANGVSGILKLSRNQVLSIEPNLSSDLAGGLFVESAGIVVPFDFVFALVENAVANGAQLRIGTEVQKIIPQKEQFVVCTNRGIIRTKMIVNAAGVSGAKVAAMIGDDSITVSLRKGEEYLLDRRLEGLVKHTVFPVPSETSKGILVIPTVEGNIMLGPTSQKTESSNDLTTTEIGWNQVFQEAKSLVPSLNKADLITSFAGLRAGSNTDDFIIARSPVSHRFINAVGIDSPGLTAAPAIAEYVMGLLQDSGLQLKQKRRFTPRRPLLRVGKLDQEKRNKLIAENPAYGRIVCRCEQISEGEIRAAIHRGATTLDGVKLRTRSGMGRCQGSFCTPKTIFILSEELKIPLWEVTKNGPGSQVLAGSLREQGHSHEMKEDNQRA